MKRFLIFLFSFLSLSISAQVMRVEMTDGTSTSFDINKISVVDFLESGSMEEDSSQKEAVTGAVSDFGCSYATIVGYANTGLPSIANTSSIEMGIEISEYDDFYYSNRHKTNSITGNRFEVLADGLNPKTEYFYRAYVYAHGIYYNGEIKSFITKDFDNIVTSCTIYDITDYGASCELVYNSTFADSKDARYNGVMVGVDYGFSENDLHYCEYANISTEGHSSIRLWTDCGKIYYYRAFTKVGNTKKYFGSIGTFKTPDIDIYYESAACYTGWNKELGKNQTTIFNPWSQGYSYTQATGYQKWDGSDSKSNKEAEGFLVSPSFKTSAKNNNVVFSFDYCIGYANNDRDFAKHFKIYVSRTYTEGSIDLAEWEQIKWHPTHTTTDWTLANTTNIALPAEFQNQDNVHLAFWAYAPEGGSATFEIKNFVLETGQTQYVEEGITPDVPDTPTSAEGDGSLVSPFNVAGIIKYTKSLPADVNSDPVYFKGYVVAFKNGEEPGNPYGNATFYISDDGKNENTFYCFRVLGPKNEKWTSADQLKIGDRVVLYGPVMNYRGNTPETVANTCYVISINGITPDGPTDPVIGGSEENGDFESWNGSTPLHWTTQCTAGNATLKQSTDAHSGTFSVEVVGMTGANKRLGREEMYLVAGSYTMTFWVKAATSAGASVRPGYVPVQDGKVGTYVFGEYLNDVPCDKWILHTHSFEIPTSGVYSLVIMNSKNPGANVLIDDFKLYHGETIIIQ